MLTWTAMDDDTIARCRVAIDNCRRYNGNAMPWFGLCLRMYQMLENSGLLNRIEVEQESCRGCVWTAEGGGCRQHFDGAHMDTSVGKVLFCPKKTTQAMRDAQLALHTKRGRR